MTGKLIRVFSPMTPHLTLSSHRCMAIIAGVLGRAGEEGRNRRLEAASAGEVPFHVQHHLVLPKDVETGVDSDDRVLNLAMNGRAQGEIRFAPVKPS